MNFFNIKNHLIYTTKLDNYLEVFLFMSLIISTNLVLFKYNNDNELIDKLKNNILKKLNIIKNKKMFGYILDFIIHFIHSFIHLYILYVLFGYGISMLGPCQKIIKCK